MPKNSLSSIFLLNNALLIVRRTVSVVNINNPQPTSKKGRAQRMAFLIRSLARTKACYLKILNKVISLLEKPPAAAFRSKHLIDHAGFKVEFQ